MANYSLIKYDGTALVTVSENTINTVTTSLSLIGQKKMSYGQPQNQNYVWLIENFARSTSPDNPMVGQLWYDLTNQIAQICTNTVGPVFEPVGSPKTTEPGSPYPGQLWWDEPNDLLKIWNDTLADWTTVGPTTDPAASITEVFYLTRTTANNTPAELWVDGTASNRMVLPNDTTWIYRIDVVARRTDSTGDYAAYFIEGMINNTTNTVSLLATSASVNTLYQNQATWAIAVTADNVNKALVVTVTGENAKTIKWNGVGRVTFVT